MRSICLLWPSTCYVVTAYIFFLESYLLFFLYFTASDSSSDAQNLGVEYRNLSHTALEMPKTAPRIPGQRFIYIFDPILVPLDGGFRQINHTLFYLSLSKTAHPHGQTAEIKYI